MSLTKIANDYNNGMFQEIKYNFDSGLMPEKLRHEMVNAYQTRDEARADELFLAELYKQNPEIAEQKIKVGMRDFIESLQREEGMPIYRPMSSFVNEEDFTKVDYPSTIKHYGLGAGIGALTGAGIGAGVKSLGIGRTRAFGPHSYSHGALRGGLAGAALGLGVGISTHGASVMSAMRNQAERQKLYEIMKQTPVQIQ